MTLDPLEGEGRAMEENRELSPPELSPTKPSRSRLCPARAGSVLMNALHAEHSLRESHAVSPAARRGLLINIDNGGTLTDFCVIDGDKVHRTKSVTTPYDLPNAFSTASARRAGRFTARKTCRGCY